MNTWPPIDEPIVPAVVVARLDELGWTADCTRLLEHTSGVALAAYNDKLNPVLYVLVALWDGHRIASYGTEQTARAAFAVVVRRADEPGDDE